MTPKKTSLTFRIDTWTPDGESIVKHVAGVEDYQVALATYRAVCSSSRDGPGLATTPAAGTPGRQDAGPQRRLRCLPSPTR